MMVSREPKDKIEEFEPDAWERFGRAVDIVAKSPPQHRTKRAKDVAESTQGDSTAAAKGGARKR
jgi:hypothetical protein